MFCPACRAEYREGIFRCADCDVTLVHQLDAATEFAPAATDKYHVPAAEGPAFRAVALWRGNDPVTYTALVEALSEAHIPNFNRFVTGQQLEPLLPHLYDIYVLERDLPEAQEIARETVAAAAARDAAAYEVPSELFAAEPDPDPEAPAPEDIGNDDSFPVVWTGVNRWLAEALHEALGEQAIPARQINDTAGVMHIFVRAGDLGRAAEIVRRMVDLRRRE